MLTINVHKWATLLIYGSLLWCTAPMWLVGLEWLATRPGALWFVAGVLVGAIVPSTWAYNAGLALRRDQAIERAKQEYEKDKANLL